MKTELVKAAFKILLQIVRDDIEMRSLVFFFFSFCSYLWAKCLINTKQWLLQKTISCLLGSDFNVSPDLSSI